MSKHLQRLKAMAMCFPMGFNSYEPQSLKFGLVLCGGSSYDKQKAFDVCLEIVISPWPPPHQCLRASKFRLVTWSQIVLAASKKSLASTSCCICHWLASVCKDGGESPNLTNKTIVILNLSDCHKVRFHSGKKISLMQFPLVIIITFQRNTR